MVDIGFIRQNQDLIQAIAERKGIAVSIPAFISWEEKKRNLLKEAEALRNQRNQLSRLISQLVHQGTTEELPELKEQAKAINSQLRSTESALMEAEAYCNELMLLIPNIVSHDTPIGRSDADNVEIKRVGEPSRFDFAIKDHVALGETHEIIDIPRGVKVAGTRNYFLKGAGVYLHRAVQQLAIELLSQRGYTVLDVPLMVRKEALVNTGFFPLGQDQAYELANEEKWLVGTSEVPLVSYYSNEIIDVLNQPIKLAAVSTCFRSEVGSAGKDVRGLYRVHQFAKVEQVIFCANDPALSEQLLQEIVQNAEDILQLLELPYRVVAVCAGDMAQKTFKQYDIETWMPSRCSYGETHSASNVLDFQARRSNIRYRDASGRLEYCHTLNNTAVATPRILIPLLENHQNPDGSITIPKALRKYMGGLEKLVARD